MQRMKFTLFTLCAMVYLLTLSRELFSVQVSVKWPCLTPGFFSPPLYRNPSRDDYSVYMLHIGSYANFENLVAFPFNPLCNSDYQPRYRVHILQFNSFFYLIKDRESVNVSCGGDFSHKASPPGSS